MTPTSSEILALYRLWGHLPRVFRRAELETVGYHRRVTVEKRCIAAQANVMTSEIQYNDKLHAPVLDIDVPCTLLTSSTPGHFHLIIEKAMTWRQYRRLLRALGKAGILERNFVHMSIARRYSAVRVPWVKKRV